MTLAASTSEKLAFEDKTRRLYVELRAIKPGGTPRATFARPDYTDSTRCFAPPCEWVLAPDTAAKYEFRAFLVDPIRKKAIARSESVPVAWSAPARPSDIELLINGKKLPITALVGGTEIYHAIPTGKQRVEALWKTDALGTGYEVRISAPKVEKVCSSGTSCLVPERVPIKNGQEMDWVVKVVTARGKKLVSGFKVCVVGKRSA